MIVRPETDKPFALSGGSDTWDTPAGALLAADYFPDGTPKNYTLNATPAALSCAYSAQGAGYVVQPLSPGTSGAGTFGSQSAVSEDGRTRVVSWSGTGAGDRLEVFRLAGDSYVYDHTLSTAGLGSEIYITALEVSASGRYVALSYAPTDDTLSGVAILEQTGESTWSVVYNDTGAPYVLNYALLRFTRDETILVYAPGEMAPRVAGLDGTWSLVQTLTGAVPEGCSYAQFVASPSLSMLALRYTWQEDAQTVPTHLYLRDGLGFSTPQAITPPTGEGYYPLAVSDNGRIFCSAGTHIGDGSDDVRFVALVREGGAWVEQVVPLPTDIYHQYLADSFYSPALSLNDDTLVLTGYETTDAGPLTTIYTRTGVSFVAVGSLATSGWSITSAVSADGRTVFLHAPEEVGGNGGGGVTHILDAAAGWSEVEAISAAGAASINDFNAFVARDSSRVVLDGRQSIYRPALQLVVTRPDVIYMSAPAATLPIASVDATLQFHPVVSMSGGGNYINVLTGQAVFSLVRRVVADAASVPIIATETAPRTHRMTAEPASIGMHRYGMMLATDSVSLPYNNNSDFRRVLALSGDGNTLAYGYYPETTVGSGGKIDVYVRNGTAWEFQATLVPDGLITGAAVIGYERKFACSASLTADGNTLVSVANITGYAEALCVFERIGSVWSHTQTVAVDPESRKAIISADGSTVLIDEDTQYFGYLRRVNGQYVNMATGVTEISTLPGGLNHDGSRTVYLSYNDSVYRVFNTRTMTIEATLQESAYAADDYASISADGSHAAVGIRVSSVSYVQMWHRVEGVWSAYATIDPPGIGAPIGCALADDAHTLLIRQAVTGGETLHKYRRDGDTWGLIGSTSILDTWQVVTTSSRGGRALAVSVDDPTTAITYDESAYPVNLTIGHSFAAETAVTPIVDVPAGLRLVRAIVASTAAIPVTASAASSARAMPAEAAALPVVGLPIGFEYGGARRMAASTLALSVTSSPVALLKSIPPLSADPASAPIGTTDAGLLWKRKAVVESVAIGVVENQASLIAVKPFFVGALPIVGRSANLIGPMRRLLAETGTPVAVTIFPAGLGPLFRMVAPVARVPLTAIAAVLVKQELQAHRLVAARAVLSISSPPCQLVTGGIRFLTADSHALPLSATECYGRRTLPASRAELPVTSGAVSLKRTYRLAVVSHAASVRSADALLYLRRTWSEECDRSIYVATPSRRINVMTRPSAWWVNR